MNRFMVSRWPIAILLLVAASAFARNDSAQADSPFKNFRRRLSGPASVVTKPVPVIKNVVRIAAEAVPGVGDIQWHDDLDEGWKAARESRRPMLIFITSDHCHYCDSMKQITWRNGGVQKRLQDDFVAIRLSPDRNAETLSRIRIPGYPTTLIGHPDGKILAHKVGYQAPAEISRLMETANPIDESISFAD